MEETLETEAQPKPNKPETLWKRILVEVSRSEELGRDFIRLDKKTKQYGLRMVDKFFEPHLEFSTKRWLDEKIDLGIEFNIYRGQRGKLVLEVHFEYVPRAIVTKKHELCDMEIRVDADEDPDFCPEAQGGCGRRWNAKPNPDI
ncbi:MAG: hypothetical protein HYS87_00235 [Candidatus Colwellbacteria bacterium]|nr:hypothetical protein [Candidatus Colwellbacteria bacterium]